MKMNWSYYSKTRGLVITALLSSLSAALQSTGDLLPGIGYILSMLSSAPLIIACDISVRNGALAYILSVILLFVILPREALVFAFTTGILGLGIGLTSRFIKSKIAVVTVSALVLTLGIGALLFGLQFPVLGPVSPVIEFNKIAAIYVFSYLYTWVWVEFYAYFIKKTSKALFK